MRFPLCVLILFLLGSCDGNIGRIEELGEKLRSLPNTEVYDSTYCSTKIPEITGITPEVYSSLFYLPHQDSEMKVVKLVPSANNYFASYELTMSGGKNTSAHCEMHIFLNPASVPNHYRIVYASRCLGCG